MKNVYKDRECQKTVKIGVFLNIASIGPKIKPSIKHFFRFYQIRFLDYSRRQPSKNASKGNDCHIIQLSPL